jgi:hypothetical protein
VLTLRHLLAGLQAAAESAVFNTRCGFKVAAWQEMH